MPSNRIDMHDLERAVKRSTNQKEALAVFVKSAVNQVVHLYALDMQSVRPKNDE